MGGEGSGRRADPVKAYEKQHTAIASGLGEGLFIPDYSGIQKAALKTSPALGTGGGIGTETDPIFGAMSGSLPYASDTLFSDLSGSYNTHADDTTIHYLSGSIYTIMSGLSGSATFNTTTNTRQDANIVAVSGSVYTGDEPGHTHTGISAGGGIWTSGSGYIYPISSELMISGSGVVSSGTISGSNAYMTGTYNGEGITGLSGAATLWLTERPGLSGAASLWATDKPGISGSASLYPIDKAGLSGSIVANTTHRNDNTQAHTDYLLNNASDSTTGMLTAGHFNTAATISGANIFNTGDHNTSGSAFVVGVIMDPSATPPTASNFPQGTIYLQYTA